MKYSHNYHSGFTLVEVLVTITILGILLAVAGVSGLKSGNDSAQLTAVTRKLVSDLRLLRTKAITENQRCGIDLTGSDKYSLCHVDISTSPDSYICYKEVSLPRGITISGDVNKFHFAPTGNIFGTRKIKIYHYGLKKGEVEVNQLGTIQLKN